MQYLQLKGLLDSRPEERKKFFNDLIHSPRNDLLQTYRDYYNGIHWKYDEDGRSNTTRSGKQIWGKTRNNYYATSDPYQRNTNRNRVSFSRGQLQTINYINRFITVYQDNILGRGEQELKITTGNEEADEYLKESYGDMDAYVKEQLARMVINTVAIDKIKFHDDQYHVKPADAKEMYPVYMKDMVVGFARSYMIDWMEAKSYGINTKTKKDVPYAEVYYQDQDDMLWYFARFVDGRIVNDGGEPERLVDELQFNPCTMVANIDHPFDKFDDDSLESTEMNEWIDKNDSLNATRTIEFLTNLFLASPKVSVDHDQVQNMGLSLADPAIQDAINSFQMMPYTIDTFPFKIMQGNAIPESFYKGLDMTRDSLFEDANIPRFMASGSIPSGTATETLELGMLMLETKLNQKREQLETLIKQSSEKILMAAGLAFEEIDVDFPPITGMSTRDMIREFRENTIAGILPKRYTRDEVLKLLNKGEDVGLVQNIDREDLVTLRESIDQQRTLVANQLDAEAQVRNREEVQRQLAETEERISELT